MMHMLKSQNITIQFLALSLLLCSCKQPSPAGVAVNNYDYEDLPHIQLTNPDTLLTYSSEYPVGVRADGKYLYVKKALTDTLIDVIDLETNQIIWQTGTVGQGPNDVVSLDFISCSDSSESSEFEMYDINGRTLLFIDPVNKEIRKEKFPDFISGHSADLAFFNDYTIGVKNNEECMFYIQSNDGETHIDVENDIDLGDDIVEKYGSMSCNYILSVSIVPDDVNKRIIAAHYFFDKFSVYDFSGNLLSTTTLSGDSYSTKKAFNNILNENGHTAYPDGYSSGDACYLKRLVYGADRSETISNDIIKVDWDGIPTAIIDTGGPVIGKFYIDKENNLYAIVKSASDDNEFYHIVRWKLPFGA